MRNILLITFLLALILTGCGDSIKPGLDKQISSSDSLKIYFFNEIDNAPPKVITLKEKSEIDEMIASITDEESEQYKCGYSGQMEFYQMGKIILSPEFNFSPDCAHYVFRYKDQMYHKKMSPEGQKTLVILANN
ncbi:MAG: hypothetical protein KDC73_14005 [Ignavibacteriae bacterium]|nr:hypothetical protein [Ignavibacteriota bacterium]MCB9244769.1 hypothetical protein [Ignavibacteriales bacterium]